MGLDFNNLQAELIFNSEKAHFFGLRSSSLAGPYNELLLMRLFQKTFPEVGFARGNIVMEMDDDGFVKSRKYKQVDIICYRTGREYFKFEDLVTIKKHDVYLAIEVKKWSSPKLMENLQRSIRHFEKEYSPVRMFGVVFRIWRSRNFNLKKIGKREGLYIFSHSSQKANEWQKPNHLLRQLEREIVGITEIIYEGELKRLIEDIRKTVE